MTLLVIAPLAFVTILVGQAPAAPGDPKPRAAAVLAAIAAKDFATVEAQFDDKMKAALPPGRLAATWETVVAQAGALKTCDANVRVVAIADKQMVITTCEFERVKFDAQFAFDPSGRISGLAFRPPAPAVAPYSPPAYAKAGSYLERDLTVGTEWALPATLTVPLGDGPFPAVVLVHGSGPSDRDETVGASKPFKDLALGLASRGVAVLRYEKRTRVHASRMAATAGMTAKDETTDDALAALAVLRGQPTIDPARVFVLGHSLGGMLVPRIAAADPRLAGAIVMAGPARPIGQAILEQTRHVASADGTVTADEQARIDEAARTAASIEKLTESDVARGTRVFNVPASYWLDLKDYDPPTAATSLKIPMLILQGARDYQVTMAEFGRWKTTLASRADVVFHSYSALNHLFIAGTGASLPAEYQLPGHVAEEVVTDIADWIGRVRPSARD